MRLHDDWASPALDREPTAADVGPFPRRGFLEAWWSRRGHGEFLLAESEAVALPLVRGPDGLEIAGEASLTDYHSPLGVSTADVEVFGEQLAAVLPPSTPFCFDSLPGEVAIPLAEGMARSGVVTVPRRHEAAAVLDLPADYEEYLASLRSKDRHEVRRKGRRFEASLGAADLDHDPSGFDLFLEMHRSAAGRKGSFMDETMEGFFRDLLDVGGARVSVLRGGGTPVAAAFGFEDDRAYYLYNSGYAPAHAEASPGAVLVDRMIHMAIAAGKRRFDFLKGDESYKYRLGATPRPLFAIEATT
jgi:CelD/BcsL family acetyltransferase involved in cellulose biosynthesis